MNDATLYEATIPVFEEALRNLLRVLGKAERWAKKKRVPMKKLLHAKLAPDMFDLTQQVQYAYFMALDAATNLGGKQVPKGFNYDEGTMRELVQSIKQTQKFLQTIKPHDFKGATKRRVPLFSEPKRKLGAREYVRAVAVPNFFFHHVMVYAILRHIAVPLRKTDYLSV